MSGQLINKWTHHRLTNLLRSISGDRGRKYTIAGDTDSVVGDTFIDVNGVKQTIAEFYDSISDDQLIRDELDNKVKLVDGCQGLSVNVKTKEIESKPIKYVMKHRVKKRMYAIHVDGKKVIVTEDHSIMVMRDDMMISVKPKEILKSDIIITNVIVLKFNSDFEIQDLGLIEQDVYDIEIEDNHNFFGNDILVHNSLYVSIPDIVDMMLPNNKDLDIHQIVDKIDEFVKVVVDPEVNKWCVDLVDYMQAYKNKMVWEREIIAETMILIAKKHYIATVWDNEGVRYREHPKYKIVGMESKKSSTPAWARKWLEELYIIALEKDEETLQRRYSEIEDEFKTLAISEISIPTGISNIEQYADATTVYKKGTPAHVKAALFHNKLINDLNLKHLNPIVAGSKIRYVQLKEPNPLRADAIAFNDDLPAEFNLSQYVDRQSVFQKAFVDPLNIMLKSINWNAEQIITLESFFG